jgi:Protein kinase domain
MSSSPANPPDRAPDRPIAVGTMIHGYRVRGLLSERPGIDVVLEADAPDGRIVALTLYALQMTRVRALRRRLLRLARLRASIRHPYLLPVLGVHQKRGRVVLVTEIAGSWTLANRLRLGTLEPNEAVRILAQVASGLEAAAAKGLVHHDLTPGAIIIDEAEPANVLLKDFGISIPPASGHEQLLLTATESLDYRSPEQLRGEPPRPASNVYSLSCILAECLTGAPPFPHDRPPLTALAHEVEPPPRISERRDDLPPDIDRVIAKGMAKDPRKRFASPTQLIRAAAPALQAKTPAIAIPAPKKQQHRRQRAARRAAPSSRRRRNALRKVRAPAWVGLALLVSALGGFATGNLDRSPERSAPAATPVAPVIRAAEQRAVREQRTEYVQAVGRTMKRLDRRRDAARRRLQRARRPRNQAVAAQAYAAAFADARKSLPAGPSSLPRAPLSGSLREAQRAYRGLAVAARRDNTKAWKAARREALQHEKNVERALAELRSRYDQLERSAASTKA